MSATVEWVETTGKTVEEAKEAALDRLGVDEQDAEFEVIEEPRSGLFGRTRGVGRVRARVVPRAPRSKPERRKRSRSDKGGRGEGEERTGTGSASSGEDSATTSATRAAKPARQASKSAEERSQGKGDSGRGGSSGRGPSSKSGSGARPAPPEKEREVMDTAEQCDVVTTFLDGLGRAFGLEVTANAQIEDDVLRASIDGSEVGLFIGPGMATLDAIQEITRNVLQRHAEGREYAKVVVDVAGVRQMRRERLAAFVTDAAQQVLDDDVEVVFEVMSSPDRKVVHDTVAEIDGVASSSIGESPRRRVVLSAAG